MAFASEKVPKRFSGVFPKQCFTWSHNILLFFAQIVVASKRFVEGSASFIPRLCTTWLLFHTSSLEGSANRALHSCIKLLVGQICVKCCCCWGIVWVVFFKPWKIPIYWLKEVPPAEQVWGWMESPFFFANCNPPGYEHRSAGGWLRKNGNKTSHYQHWRWHDRNHFNMAFFKTWKGRCLQIHHGHLKKKTIFLNKELPYPIHRAATLVANVADPSCLKFSIKVEAFRVYSDIFCVAVHVFLATLCSPQGCLHTIHFKSWQHSFMGSWCTSFLRKIWF